ncbi:MAG: M15 family metallopeptidase [Polyangiales bacterium]
MRRWLAVSLAAAAVAGGAYSLRTGAHPRHGEARASRHHHHRRHARSDARPAEAHARDAGVDAARAVPVVPAVTARAPVPLRRTPVPAAPEQPCVSLVRPDRDGRWVHAADVLPPMGFVPGDDLLTLVNRSPRFVLPPDYIPGDLVEIDTGLELPPTSCVPPHRQCLRRDAASALRVMLDAMAAASLPGHVHSAYRSFITQCGVFRKWSYGEGEGFCHATTSSAIAGHSQHQLGTAVDLFTEEWMHQYANPMRGGFGCTPGGRWIAEHAWEFGWVIPYPLPLAERAPGSDCRRRDGGDDVVDPRTGYRYEPWHLRYIGVDAAARFHAAWLDSGVSGPHEVTLEQWLRAEHGVDGDVDLPVCDGCSCGLCTTFHDGAPAAVGGAGARARAEPPRPTGPCGDRALLLGADGEPVPAEAPPTLTAAEARREYLGVRVLVTVAAPAHTVTQTPVTSQYAGVYGAGMTWRALQPFPQPRFATLARAYPDLRGAWRVALAPRGDASWPWRAALRNTATPAWVNGANLRLPVAQGLTHVEVVVPPVGDAVRVTLLRDGDPRGAVIEAPIR